MIELVRTVAADEEFDRVVRRVMAGQDGLVTGLSGSARHLYLAGLHLIQTQREPKASTLIVTHSQNQAEAIYDDLCEYLPDETVLLFPEKELAIVDVMAYSPDVVADRVRVLERATSGERIIIVATLASVIQPVAAKALHLSSRLVFQVGQESPVPDVAQALLQLGYERVEMVENKGQFSLRGGIIDIFPMAADHAYRIELFDTEVDSVRTFDVVSQRSLEQCDSATVGPALDLFVARHTMQSAAENLSTHLNQRLRTITDDDVRDRLQTVVGADIRRLAEGMPFYGQFRYTELFTGHVQTLLNYLSPGSTVCFDEPSRLLDRQKGLEKEFEEWVSSALLRGEMVSGTLGVPAFHELWDHKGFPAIQFSTFTRTGGTGRYAGVVSIASKSMQTFHGQMNVLKSEVAHWQKAGTRVLFFAPTAERVERLSRVLTDYRIDVNAGSTAPGSTLPVVLEGNLSSGFELPLLHLAVIIETEVFPTRKKNRRMRSEMSDAERIKSYQELRIGDHVVHVNHGIGKYLGIRTLDMDGLHKDYLHLQYAGNDSLYVPVDQIDQVQRYIGSDDKEPKVHHLGGGEWTRTKQKVSRSVKDIAEELVKLYASRQATKGHPFLVDTPWQKDFEAMFPYEETPDQLRAIREIKGDMEKGRPMDRLLCGDVGYGKTEVAIRAAFKAVMDGKQVAVLVPTTVLAHQHFETFRERFAGFPVTIETLSRFRGRSDSQAVVKGLRDGSIDVVIGTHRLLQKSIQFKDLGLLIVDEEQRFGVTHKERLKQIRTNVDCLTLTATPIPRTLHMSLLGVRDLSVIETPPENRFPVQTYVVEFNESLVREAIERELNRGGQVYVLFNHVNGIRSMADRISRLVSEARVQVAHGQMAENELERVMMDFLDGEIDVLVTTTIIETGLDIPNVNTLIVYDADRLGLAQLYQLRGRVGRSNRIAYAYFTYQKDKVLTEVAEKRLQAIKEFTELGSGFKIAMRDLSIRGAGNLLGAEQHGFINSVGFDMYNEMLAHAVKELRGEQEEQTMEPTIELGIEAYLPDEYIPNPAQKIAMYKKFKYVRSLPAADELTEEIIDRYGELPDAVENLLDVTRMKSYAVQFGFEGISRQGSDVILRIHPEFNARIDHPGLFSVAKRHAGNYMKRPSGQVQIVFRWKGVSDKDLCRRLLQFFADFANAVKAKREVEEVAK